MNSEAVNIAKVFWEITGSCQLRCRYCFYRTGINAQPKKHVSMESARIMIDRISEYFGSIVLTGGEPLLHPSYRDIIAIAHNMSLRIELITDGLLLDTNCAEYLARHRLTRVARQFR